MQMNKKLAALPILAIISLSIVGLVYAHWEDIVYINGTIEMGTCTIAFSRHPADPIPLVDEYWWDGDLTHDPIMGEPKGKDVGFTEAWYDEYVIDEKGPCDDNWGWRQLMITVQNAYPGYYPHIIFTIHNIGTIPVDITFNVYDPDGILTWHDIPRGPFDYWWVKGYFTDPDGNEVMNITVLNLLNPPFQLDPCQGEKGEIDIHIKQTAQECNTYKFVVEIIGTEYDP
jgi:hypothetical protein